MDFGQKIEETVAGGRRAAKKVTLLRRDEVLCIETMDDALDLFLCFTTKISCDWSVILDVIQLSASLKHVLFSVQNHNLRALVSWLYNDVMIVLQFQAGFSILNRQPGHMSHRGDIAVQGDHVTMDE